MSRRKQSFAPSAHYLMSGSHLLVLEAIGFQLTTGTLSQTQCAFTAGRIASILDTVEAIPHDLAERVALIEARLAQPVRDGHPIWEPRSGSEDPR